MVICHNDHDNCTIDANRFDGVIVMIENTNFIRMHIDKYNEIINQLSDYEKSLLKIYHYAIFKEDPMEFIKEELHNILMKY